MLFRSSIEVKVNIPITGTSFTSLLLAILLVVVGYSSYLGVKSLWNFTHPKIGVSFDGVKALTYLIRGQNIPSIGLPKFSEKNPPSDLAKQEFLQSIREFRSEFVTKYPKSARLMQMRDEIYLYYGASFCKAKEDSISKTGKYSAQDIINAHQSKVFFLYPRLSGLDVFIEGVGTRAFDHLCKG